MMTNPERVLASLRDVAGVEGSWLLGVNGQVHARDLSALYPDSILESLGTRFVQMTDAAADHLPGCTEDLFLRFDSRTLFLRRVGPLVLVVLTLPTTNPQSLRIGVHLVFRQLTAPPSAPAPAPPGRVVAAPARLPSLSSWRRHPPRGPPRPRRPSALPASGAADQHDVFPSPLRPHILSAFNDPHPPDNTQPDQMNPTRVPDILPFLTQSTFFMVFMAMAAAALFIFLERGSVPERFRSVMAVSVVILAIAATNYFYMFNVYRDGLARGDGHFPTAFRYIDWLLTTPLLLLEFPLLLGVGARGVSIHASGSSSWTW